MALNANLPTGKTVLLGSQANARMDPDFVDISTFGEGFNLGPTAGFNFPITDTLLITTSLGYTWRGRFTQDLIGDLTNPFLTSRVDPGENLTATGAINYQIGQLALGFTGAVTWETPTSVDGTNTLQPGNRFLLALQASYIWPDNIGTTVLNASARSFQSQQNTAPWIFISRNRNLEFEFERLSGWAPAHDTGWKFPDWAGWQCPLSRSQRLQLGHPSVCATKDKVVSRHARSIHAKRISNNQRAL